MNAMTKRSHAIIEEKYVKLENSQCYNQYAIYKNPILWG